MGSWRLFAPFLAALFALVLVGCSNEVALDGAPTTGVSPVRVTTPVTMPAPTPSTEPAPSYAPLPFGAQPDEWTWVDFPDSHCANGSPTGLAVNVRPGAKKLVLFLQGGGACADGDECWGAAPTAIHLDGYDIDQFAVETQLVEVPLFARDGANAFADASYVFVPYCTGDLHAGDNVATYDVGGQSVPTWHYGAHNLDLYLPALARAFPGLDRVWLAGQSAGGFGTLFNQDFVARAFGARTDVIDDSGPGIGTSGYPDSWNVRLPPGCTYCGNGLASLFLYDRATYPDARFAFLSFQIDAVLPGFYGATEQDVVEWLIAFESLFGRLDNTEWFVAAGTGHVVMGSPLDAGARAALPEWLAAMASDDGSWQSTMR
jgi:hypothetical protein